MTEDERIVRAALGDSRAESNFEFVLDRGGGWNTVRELHDGVRDYEKRFVRENPMTSERLTDEELSEWEHRVKMGVCPRGVLATSVLKPNQPASATEVR